MTSSQTIVDTIDTAAVLSRSPLALLIPDHRELIPDLAEVYEFELAYYESELLSDEELLRNGAYFARVGDRLTRHFLICQGEPVKLPKHSSSKLRSFFTTNQFRTGYGTHGLFPYRGKFHPQMIKGLMNAMGLRPGQTVLDPMMGSGTVLIEATLMGIKSIGFDISPFCRFMTNAKLEALEIPLDPIRPYLDNPKPLYEYFRNEVGSPGRSDGSDPELYPTSLFSQDGNASSPHASRADESLSILEDQKTYDFLLLAYLDSAGYALRSKRKSPFQHFSGILERYVFVADKIQRVLDGAEEELGDASAREADARDLPLDDGSVDGIVFSPPYSFAIDYLENDEFHLNYMGVDLGQLRSEMVGLRGKTRLDKYQNYKSDMEQVIAECSRVLRPGALCSIVVGTNNNQLGKILKVPADQVQGLDELLTELASRYGMNSTRKLSRRISGMANTMRTEYILMLQKE